MSGEKAMSGEKSNEREKIMNEKISKSVSIDRVHQLIECYGARVDSWPEDEKAPAKTLLQASAELQQCRSEAARLDNIIELDGLDGPGISSQLRGDSRYIEKIISQLPVQEEGRHRRNNIHWFDSLWNKPRLMAASVAAMLVAVFILQSKPIVDPQPDTSFLQSELDQWMLDDVTDPSQNDVEEDFTFMTLVELE